MVFAVDVAFAGSAGGAHPALKQAPGIIGVIIAASRLKHAAQALSSKDDMVSSTTTQYRPSPLLRYAIAILISAAAVLLRLNLTPLIGVQTPYILFFPAVFLAAWYGGLGPAIVTIVLSSIASVYFLILPHHSLTIRDTESFVSLGVFLVVAFLIAFVTDRGQTARRLLQENLVQLQEETERRHRLADELLQSERSLATTLRSVGDAVIATDTRGIVTFINGVAERLTGWTSEEAVGKPAVDVFKIENEETRAPVESPIDRVIRDGIIVGLANHTVLVSKTGTALPIEDSAAPITDDDGKLLGVVLVFRDASDRRDAEKAQIAAREQLQSILESITDAFVSLDAEWRVTYANRAAAALTGRSPEDMIGHTYWDVWPSIVGTELERQCRRAVQEKTSVRYEHRRISAGDPGGEPSVKWMDIHAYPSRDGLSIFFSDITTSKEAEHLIRESEERFRLLADTIPHIVWTMRQDGQVEYVNRAWAEYTGIPAEEAMTINWQSRVHPDDQELIHEAWRDAFRTGEARHTEYRLRRFDGEYRWNLARALPVRNSAGKVIRWVGTETDVDDQKRAEAVLVERAEELVRISERNRNIATQLQQALLPKIPESSPGLVIAPYHRAALDEASVGGDFYDVFEISPGRTALIVGDVSGKGLAAAAQVATIRNMLRFALYSGSAPAKAVGDVNRTLADHDLLTGFATLFVGVFDYERQFLTYVSCGQEPALLYRAATRRIELLQSTGAVLGGWADAGIGEARTRLYPGDVLASFTDGLTETGPNRQDLVGIEGLAAIFEAEVSRYRNRPPADAAPLIVNSLISAVDGYARGGVRDDICLLLTVVRDE